MKTGRKGKSPAASPTKDEAAAHFEAAKAHAKRAREALEALGDLGLADWGTK